MNFKLNLFLFVFVFVVFLEVQELLDRVLYYSEVLGESGVILYSYLGT